MNELQTLWFSRVEAFIASGLTQAEFCRRNEYKLKQFNYWVRKFRKQQKAQNNQQDNDFKWLSVDLVQHDESNSITIQIGAATLEVNPGFDKNLLSEVVEVLGKLC